MGSKLTSITESKISSGDSERYSEPRIVDNPYLLHLGQMWLMRILLIFVMGLAIGMPRAWASPVPSYDVVHLQLRWHHQFQFAGYYAAIEKGFYKAEGLDVRVHNGSPSHQPVSEVLSGRAQYAEGNSEVLFQRLQGEPLVALAAIFQHSPSVLLTLEGSGIRTVHDLIGKNVMLANKSEDADFLTMLLNEGVEFSQLDIVPSSYDLNDLIVGKTDAFNSYMTNEPYLLDQLGVGYNVIDPLNYRVDFYSDIFFTTEEEIRHHPQRVESMLRATLKGWKYAMNHPEEIIELLKTKYNVSKSREHLRFEAEQMRKLIIPDLIQMGHMNPERWQHMADTFIKAGLIEDDQYLDGFIYESDDNDLPYWMMPAFLSSMILLVFTTSVTLYLHRFNRRLSLAKQHLQQSEERFKVLSAATYGGIIIHDRGQILECNSGLSDITGYTYSELIGMKSFSLIAPGDMSRVLENVRVGFDKCYEAMGIRKDGSQFPLTIKGKNISYKGREARVIEIIDITERKKTEEQLKLAASVFTHAREGIMITNPNGEIVEVNDTFSHITGYSREEVLGQNPRFLKSGRHNEAFYKEIWASLLEHKQWSGELWNRRKNDEIFAELITISAVFDAYGETQNYVALFSDITPIKQQQQQLELIAHYDTLTNLPNRRLLRERLSEAVWQCDQHQQSLAVAYLDLDGFKAINDTFGHDVGDELLVKLSKMMSETLRERDTIARIGGDEFVVVLADIESMAACEQVLDRLLHAAMSPITIGNRTLQVSTSIGVTVYPQDDVDADQLMRHADQAMYIAKQSGRNRYHLFDVDKDKTRQTQREIIERIQQGIDQQEFVLHYQPKVNMRTGKVIGVEALVRWEHPERGLIYPDDFLKIIDKHSVSLKLGEWVLDSVLDQMVQWQSEGVNISVSVNIDAFQLQQKDFVDNLISALHKRPSVKPEFLQLEILETSALEDINEVLVTMKACMEFGITFALDDFGTGFSSLTYLKRLPVDVLKIDQSFIREMLSDSDDRAIVLGVIGLASAFNLQVTAEGVESVEHGLQLLSMGCELGQGHGISLPMIGEHIPNWLSDWQPDNSWLEAELLAGR
ncbi:EAL domain-containing protein [Vibrio sp. T187]|uniref:EAL domain-containing protein n=1 Tax=Vibrio TaxID=662 RepID=UPI0010CA0D98|nr:MULTISPECIES: EAL domain-containing protein [Vibrio]MBW3698332.1 EAL domain-containing protein [Vibrio sp. T187]